MASQSGVLSNFPPELCFEYDEIDHEFISLGKDWIPECDAEKRPVLNQRFSDLNEAFNFYKEYGRISGFDVRKSTQRTDGFGNIRRKYYVCSRADKNLKVNSDQLEEVESGIQRRRTTSAKCECPAKMLVLFNKKYGFYVKKFTENHNHPFVGKGEMQFLRCSRSLSEFHKRFIVDAAKTNIGPSRAHAMLKSMIGSYEDVGATVVDFRNFSRDIKQYIGKHDADMILQKFKDIKESSDPEFRFEYETDSEKHLTKLFWADGVGRQNYEVFGDVVSFDATYRTNRYGMIFIPLVGIDNHWKSVTFGSFLIEHENNENYIWACNAFKKIFGTDPKCIITDQDLAMKVALETCFPLVKHRLCMWHIMKKFPSKLGSVFCSESNFMDKMNNFIWGDHITPAEFEDGWNKVIDEFNLSDNVWLQELFEMRTYWIPAYFNDDPMVGLLRTTSRSESSNFYFGHYVQKGDTLSEFYLCYQSAIEKQRNAKAKLKFNDGLSPNMITGKRIEKDAAALYTRTMFYKVQDEIKAGTGDIIIHCMTLQDNIKTIKLSDSFTKGRIFEVTLNLETSDVQCTCKLFTRVGYLCCHAFFVLGINGINNIPQNYVSNRWLKMAEERFSTLQLGEIHEKNSPDGLRRLKTQDCWFKFQACLSDCAGNPDIMDYVSNSLDDMRKYIKDTFNKPRTRLNSEQIEQLIEVRAVEEVTILNPNQSNNKGSRKRLVAPAEKSIGGKKRAKRKCRNCKNLAYHDFRNCPHKGDVS